MIVLLIVLVLVFGLGGNTSVMAGWAPAEAPAFGLGTILLIVLVFYLLGVI